MKAHVVLLYALHRVLLIFLLKALRSLSSVCWHESPDPETTHAHGERHQNPAQSLHQVPGDKKAKDTHTVHPFPVLLITC